MENNIHDKTNEVSVDGLLTVSAAPHLRVKENTSRLMLDVIIALVPTSLMGVYFFGLRALLIILASIISAVISEAICQKALGREISIRDNSAIVTGLLLALNVPVGLEIWKVVLGSVFAIVVVKQFFGGLGANFMNPALAARALLMASFGADMARFTAPHTDLVTMATPLSGGEMPAIMDLLIGNMAGTIGEVSKIAILIGAIYLLVRKVIDLRIPVAYIGTTAILLLIFGEGSQVINHLLTGGLLLGAFFMATDYPTSPVTTRGQLIYGVGLGILTVAIRLFGGYPEGVSYAILIMNIFVPIIDMTNKPKVFGRGGENA